MPHNRHEKFNPQENTMSQEILQLMPEQLIANEANEKARPTETPEARRKRVEDRARNIAAIGQTTPVLAIATEEGMFEYVDGGSRVEAIKLINEGFCSDGVPPSEPLMVQVILADEEADLFRIAVSSNIQRTDNTISDMIAIIQEAKDRNGWKGRGADTKVAEYLGILPSRVSEYQKVSRAPENIKAMIESGEIKSLDAALKLMVVPEEDQADVARRAKEIAEDEREAKRKNKETSKSEESSATDDTKGGVTADHVRKAAAEKGHAVGKRNAKALCEFFSMFTPANYSDEVVAFFDYLVTEYVPGTGTDRKAIQLFDAAIGTSTAEKKARAAEYKEQQKAEAKAEKERIAAEKEAEKKKK